MASRNLMHTTAIVSPSALLLLAFIPSVGLADSPVGVPSDNIQITQSADTKDVLSNTATVSLDGDSTSIMAVGGSGNIAQEGDANSADFVVDGSYNTIYFAQIGNSVVTMNIEGDQNTVTLNEFGGNDNRSATLDLIMSGEGNDLEIGSSEIYAVASLLDINLTNSNYAVVKVTYSDYSTIVADIMGDGSDVTINQNSGGSYGADEFFKNSVQLFVDGVTERNNVYIEQYGNGNNVVASVVGGGNNLNVYQYNNDYMMMMPEINSQINSQTNVDVDGDDNRVYISSDRMMYDPFYFEMMYDPFYYGEINSNFAEVSVIGNGNRVDSSVLDYLNVSVAGSNNVVDSKSNDSTISVNGSGNTVYHNYYSDMDYMDPYHYEKMGRSSAITKIIGEANQVDLSFHSYAVSIGSSVSIEGDFNNLGFSFVDEGDGMFGYGRRDIAATVLGDGNSVQSTGYVNSGSGIESGDYLTFDIDGDANKILFGAIQTVGLDVDVTGDKNSLEFKNTDNIYASIYGNGNSLSVTDTSSSNNMSYQISGLDNSVNVSNIFTTLLNVKIDGDDNDVGVSGVDELNLTVSIDGDDNRYNQKMDDLYVENSFSFTVNAAMLGDHNSIIVSSVPEYAYSSLDLNIGGDSNALTVTGIGSDYLEAASSVIVDIYGDNNTVDVLAGTSAGLSVDGSDYSMNLNYDKDLGTYVNTISNVGYGNVTLTTLDGEVIVNAI